MVEREYAKALFELSTSKKQDEYYTYFKTICSNFTDIPDFLKLLTSVSISKNDKKNIIKKTYKDFDELFLDFLFVLVDNDRINIIPSIFYEYKNFLRTKNSLVVVKVKSAKALDQDEIIKIRNILENKYKYKDKEIKIKNIVDESLLGGIQILAEGESIDATLKNSLMELKESL